MKITTVNEAGWIKISEMSGGIEINGVVVGRKATNFYLEVSDIGPFREGEEIDLEVESFDIETTTAESGKEFHWLVAK